MSDKNETKETEAVNGVETPRLNIANAETTDLIKVHGEARTKLNVILDQANNPQDNPEAHIDWDKAAAERDEPAGDVKQLAHRLARDIEDISKELADRYEKQVLQDRAESDVSHIEAYTPSGRALVSDNITPAKGNATITDILAAGESPEFQRAYNERKSYKQSDNQGHFIIEKFDNATIADIYAAANTTANTLAPTVRVDQSNIVYYNDPMTPIHMMLDKVAPLDGSDQYKYYKETGAGGGSATGNAVAPKAEATAYAEQEVAAGVTTVTAEKITGYSTVSDEQLADVGAARQFVTTRLMRNFAQTIENQVINGNGTAPQWTGILDFANIQTVKKTGTIKKLDIFIDAFTKHTGTAYTYPNVLALRPSTLAFYAKVKDADGRYIWSSSQAEFPSTIYGIPVVISTHLPVPSSKNTALMLHTADFAILDKAGIMIEWGYNGSDFVSGTQTVRASCRGNVIAWRENAAVQITEAETADS